VLWYVLALIEPRENGDFEGWHRTPIERMAYLLNLLLGLDYVPPTVYRQNLGVDGRRYPNGGAVIYFVDDLKLLEEVPEADWGMDKEALLSDTRVLVCMIWFLKVVACLLFSGQKAWPRILCTLT
jgi:hypothetical protein